MRVPVIAAGGIGDARGIAAAFALGAAAVQIGTAYLFCPEAQVARAAPRGAAAARDDGTALTNVFTGRPARGIVNRVMREVGPISPLAPDFPLAAGGAGAAARRDGAGGLGRLHVALVRPGRRTRPRGACGRADPPAGLGGAGADRRRASSIGGASPVHPTLHDTGLAEGGGMDFTGRLRPRKRPCLTVPSPPSPTGYAPTSP